MQGAIQVLGFTFFLTWVNFVGWDQHPTATPDHHHNNDDVCVSDSGDGNDGERPDADEVKPSCVESFLDWRLPW